MNVSPLQTQAVPAASFLGRVDARIKLVCLVFVVVVCVTTPPDRFAAFAGYFAALVLLMIIARLPFKAVLGPVFVIMPFVLLCAAFVPFVHPDASGGGYSLGIGSLWVSRSGLLLLWNVAAKAVFGVLCIALLVHSTSFPELLRALESLRFPRLGVMLAGFVYRYVFVLADEALRMKRARDSRGYQGRWLWQTAVVGRMIGTLFLRSYERGERVYLAMLARGFQGQMPLSEHARLRAADYGSLFAVVAVFLGIRMIAL